MVNTNIPKSVSADHRLRQLGIQLPSAPTPFGNYVEVLQTGNLLYLSGMLPVVDHMPVSGASRQGTKCRSRARRGPHSRIEFARCDQRVSRFTRQGHEDCSPRRVYGDLRRFL